MKKGIVKLAQIVLTAGFSISIIAACYINDQYVCISRGTCVADCCHESCYEPSLRIWVTWPVGIYAVQDVPFPGVLALAEPDWDRPWENIQGWDSYVYWWAAQRIPAVRYSIQKKILALGVLNRPGTRWFASAPWLWAIHA